MSDYEVVGHCGKIFLSGQICEEDCKWDDLCQGCCMNDDEEKQYNEEESQW